jgi:hypothetical protein
MERPRRKLFSQLQEGARGTKKSKGNIVGRKKLQIIVITEFLDLSIVQKLDLLSLSGESVNGSSQLGSLERASPNLNDI